MERTIADRILQARIEPHQYQHDNCGPGGILAAVRKAAENPGKPQWLLLRLHPAMVSEDRLTNQRLVGFGLAEIDGQKTWRFAGEGGKLDAPGAYALIPTWYDDQTIEHAAASLGYAIARQLGPDEIAFRVLEEI